MQIFYKAHVVDIKKETNNAVSIGISVSDLHKELFNYLPGQYITFKININNREYRRSYSICSSPFVNDEIRIAVKKVKDGIVSNFLNDSLKIGDQIEIMLPNGRFCIQPNSLSTKEYVFFAGGSGITPIFSMIQSLLISQPKSKVILFYGSSSMESVLFKDRLDNLANVYNKSYSQYYIIKGTPNKSEICYDRMSIENVINLLKNHVSKNPINEYFICGPNGMMKNVEIALTQSGISNKKIHIEYFAQGIDSTNNIETGTLPNSKDEVTIKIILGGVEKTLDYPEKKISILDLALNCGLDAPYSCKEAICCSCRAKILEGKVKMVNNYALLDDEVAEGYILTCQSFPTTKTVVVSYDA